jgi:hypothetical protein
LLGEQAAAGFLARAWEEISSEVIDEVSSIYEDFDGPED